MLHRLHHPTAGDFTVLAPPVAMDGEGFRPREAVQPFASESRAILGDLGFSDAEVDALIANRVTREGSGEGKGGDK